MFEAFFKNQGFSYITENILIINQIGWRKSLEVPVSLQGFASI